MAENEIMKDNGSLYFDKDILLSIVCAAVSETNGVVGLYKPFGCKIAKILNGNADSGVRIKYTDFGIQIDAYPIVSSNVVVNDLVFKIQQNIKNSISSMINIPIKSINIHIMDAKLDQKK